MGIALAYQQELTTTTCPSCGTEFGVSSWFLKCRHEDKKSFYCPNGHSISYNETEADRLKRQLAAEKNRSEMFRRENQEKELRIRSLKGVVTKTKNRISKGVCPCCNRTFVSLQRHIATKHPDYAQPDKEIN